MPSSSTTNDVRLEGRSEAGGSTWSLGRIERIPTCLTKVLRPNLTLITTMMIVVVMMMLMIEVMMIMFTKVWLSLWCKLKLTQFSAPSQNNDKRLLRSSCLSVRSHGTTPLGFSLNFIFDYFLGKSVQKIQISLKIWRE